MPPDYVIPPYHRITYAHVDVRLALLSAGFATAELTTMLAIAGAESSWSNAIQVGQPYQTTGWGCWQITPGNSVPTVGIDQALLDLYTNARAAWVKYAGQGFHAWSTFNSGVYERYVHLI